MGTRQPRFTWKTAIEMEEEECIVIQLARGITTSDSQMRVSK